MDSTDLITIITPVGILAATDLTKDFLITQGVITAPGTVISYLHNTFENIQPSELVIRR